MKLQSDNQMSLVTVETKTILICFNEQVITIPQEEGEPVVKYEYDFCRTVKNSNRGDIIESIIRSRYSQSQMEAVVNNYLRDDKTEQQVQEFNSMQEWRTKAHEIATQVIGLLAE